MIPPAVVDKLQTAKAFTTIQVIHAARDKDAFAKALQAGELDRAVEIACGESKKTGLQIVTHTVEHGSERLAVAATLIEAFQNSVDALRSYLRKNPEASQREVQNLF